jgi:TonB-linked SusC/RagA family outer membrane protein
MRKRVTAPSRGRCGRDRRPARRRNDERDVAVLRGGPLKRAVVYPPAGPTREAGARSMSERGAIPPDAQMACDPNAKPLRPSEHLSGGVMATRVRYVIASAVLMLAASTQLARAQEPTRVQGLVTNDNRQPLAGVSVGIATLGVGAFTGDDGRYSFVIPAGRATPNQQVSLTARRIGYQPVTASINVGVATVTKDFVLASSPTQLEGVVVTAMGITREKSQLGTAMQQVDQAELNRTHDQNIVNQLAGKVSGLTVTGSGTQGGSTKLTIRGANSILGNNNPLFVVDGVPVSNASRGGSPNGGTDFGSAINDVNPDDVESISVLKGPNAAALYGSRASTGVIVITTKKGRATNGRVATEFSTNYSWDSPSILPDYQNKYGQGFGGEFQFVDGAGSGINDGADESWGPKLDGRPIDQFFGKAQPWVAHPDNVKDFFAGGHTAAGNLAFRGGTDRANARLSLGAENVQGYIPNNKFQKLSGLLSGTMQVTPKFSADATLNYINNDARNRPGVGYNTGILEQFIWFGRQVDMSQLKAKRFDENGNLYNWNYNYHNNPYWLQYENPESDERDRFIGVGSLRYDILPWLNATVRGGSDLYRLNIGQQFAAGNLNYSDPSYAGAFGFVNDYRNETNLDFLVTANRQLTHSVDVNGTFGLNRRAETFSSKSQSTSGISVPLIYNVSNAAITPTLGQNDTRRRVNSVFGSASATYGGWVTLEGTVRNDISSTLPKGNNSYVYPSGNLAFVLTEAIPALRSRTLSFAKLRGSIARVGTDADPYQLRTTYTGSSNKFAALPLFSLGNTIANANLKPEITTSDEVGLELGFFNGRISFDATYYAKSTRNQILNLTLPPSTGFGSVAINAGEIQNKGAEVLLGATPVRLSNGFEWNTSLTWAKNRGKVIELAGNLQTVQIGSAWNATVEARLNEPYGVIRGIPLLRDSTTGKLITSNGLLQPGTRRVMGNIQPDWTGGWSNTLSFKRVVVSALVDIRQGGDIFSISNMFGQYAGVFASTMRGREVDFDNPGVTVNGIDKKTGQPNTTTVTSEEYFHGLFQLHEPFIYKNSYVKLRELRVGYDLPSNWAARVNSRAVNVACVGRNLFTHANTPNIDPEFSYTTGNFQGMEFAPLPNARSIGLNLRVTP